MTEKRPMAKTRGALPRPDLTHEQRQALIRKPFRCELPGGCCERIAYGNNVIGGKTWGGPATDRSPLIGPAHAIHSFDESYLRYGAADDPRQGEL